MTSKYPRGATDSQGRVRCPPHVLLCKDARGQLSLLCLMEACNQAQLFWWRRRLFWLPNCVLQHLGRESAALPWEHMCQGKLWQASQGSRQRQGFKARSEEDYTKFFCNNKFSHWEEWWAVPLWSQTGSCWAAVLGEVLLFAAVVAMHEAGVLEESSVIISIRQPFVKKLSFSIL